jgi:hypothetical protein
MTVTLTIPERVHRIVEVRVHVEHDDDPDLSWLGDEANYKGCPPEEVARYMAQDQERLDAYNRGDWHMCYVWVALVDEDGATVVRSGGLHGVESDAGESYLDEIVRDELGEIGDQVSGDLSTLPMYYLGADDG